MDQTTSSIRPDATASGRERDLLWDTAGDLFVILGSDLRVIRTNPAWDDLLDWTDDDLRQVDLRRLLHADDLPSVQTSLAPLAVDGDRARFDARLVGKAGDYVWISWIVTWQDGRLLATGRDVSATRAPVPSHDDVVHAGRIAMLGELTASIAHEVNQPLASIAANGSAASRWLSKPTPDLDEVGSALTSMIEEAGRASEIIARIRSLAVRGHGRRLTCAVEPLLADCIELLRAQFRASGVEVELVVADGTPELLIDRVQIQQVVINLLLNAVQAMTNLSTRHIRVSVATSAQHMEISVADTGPGLEADAAENAFHAFYTTKADGMGMGLALARNIVEAHAGTLLLDRRWTGGAKFVVSLPVPVTA